MKTNKRLLGIILSAALIFTLAAPLAAAVNNWNWGASGWIAALDANGSPNTSRVLDSGGWLKVASATGLSDVTYYAEVKQSTLGEGKQIVWKAVDSKMTNLAGYMDLNTLINKSTKKNPTALVFTTESDKGRATSTSLASDTSLFYFAIPGLSDKIKLEKVKYTTDANGNPVATIASLPPGLEITRAEDYNNWQDFPGTGIYAGGLPVLNYKSEYWVRVKATAAESVSSVVKVAVLAKTAAPTVKVDVAKGRVPVKKGQHIVLTGADASNAVQTETLELDTAAIKAFAIGDKTPGGLTITAASTFYISERTVPTKPGSSATFVDLGDYTYASSARPEDFILRVKDVAVIGGVPYEVEKSAGKWSKLKTIKVTDASLVGSGIKVRIAGSATQFAGEAKTLKLNKDTGELTLT
ncbi:hypothetical protein FACS1894202_09940 [Clostridia bacterium]|nr:hypothetical protein FACS1894202_09940 [Clostridia bacterium]